LALHGGATCCSSAISRCTDRSNSPRKTVLVQMYSGSDYLLNNSEITYVNEQLVLAGWNHHMSRARAEG
jgi:hypothetical protein